MNLQTGTKITTMQSTIIKILTEIENRNRSECKEPTAPLLINVKRELLTQLSSELEAMQRAGIITIGNTINDKYIKLKDLKI